MVDKKLKSTDEIREELRHLRIARYYYQGAMRMILYFMNTSIFPQKEPKIEANHQARGIKISDRKWNEFYAYHFFRQALQDRRLLEAALFGEEVEPKFGRRTENGKEYLTIKFYPESQIKYLKIFQDYDNDGEYE